MQPKIFRTTLKGLMGLTLIAGLSACPSEQTEQTDSTTKTDTTTTTATTAPTAAATVAAANPENGAKLIVSKTCSTCHTVTKVAGAVGTIGPKLDGVATRAATQVKGMDAEAYLKQSVEKPDAFLVPKFQNLMPPTLRGTMTDAEFNDLIAFLKTLT